MYKLYPTDHSNLLFYKFHSCSHINNSAVLTKILDYTYFKENYSLTTTKLAKNLHVQIVICFV